MFKHILVPTDGSLFSQRAVEKAVAFAREAGAKVTAFYAKEKMHVYMMGGEEVMMPSVERFAEIAEHEALSALQYVDARCRDGGVACTTLSLECNHIYEGIIAAAEQNGCDLIFMASHGRRGLDALLLGSETAKVLTHTKIPVLVYR